MTDHAQGNPEDFHQLSQKLAKLEKDLTPSQTALMSGIISMAAKAVQSTPGGEVAAKVKAAAGTPGQSLSEHFRNQFDNAFTPDPSKPGRLLDSSSIPTTPNQPPRP